MIDIIFERIREGIERRRDEAALRRVQKEEAEARLEQERLEAERRRLEEEQAEIEAERERLMGLSDREIMVEMVFAMRGLHARVSDIEDRQDEIGHAVSELEDRIDSLADDISSLESRISSGS